MTFRPPNVTFEAGVRRALDDTQLHAALDGVTARFTALRNGGLASLPEADAVRDRARHIRAHTLSRLDECLAQFAGQVEAAGGHVHWAADGAAASRIVNQLAQAHGVRRVVKSKSMISEEIEINHALETAGVEVVETDLGEFVIQVAGEKPSHIIAPIIHKTRQQVGQLLHSALGMPLTDDPLQMTAAVRAKLRDSFLTADMGISGVNFGVAATGTLCLVTNEGNGRLTTTVPRLHVALMGIERLVPTLDDLAVMLQVLARSATGQKLSVYTNLLTGPRRPDEPDGPEELHVVLLDNGRSRVLASEMAEILYCIRCGACLNVCPVYREIGGHAYRSVYPGPVGAVLTPALGGVAHWPELPQASTLCGACREVCPVRIDIPRMLLAQRQEAHAVGKSPAWLRLGMPLFGLVGVRPAMFRVALALARGLTRLLARRGWLQRLPPPLSGWTDHRDFPAFAPRSFTAALKARRTRQP